MKLDPNASVWIVEDNAFFRDTLQELIEGSEGLEPSGLFGDAESALDALDPDRPPDVLLMDIELPGMDGTEAVRRIRELAPAVPVIMLTVHETRERVFQAVVAGASGYLLKSADRDEILGAVRQVLAGGAAMDPAIARRVLDMFVRLHEPSSDYGLSDREREVLKLLVEGMTKHQIAERLFLSPHTVDQHVRHIYSKLHVHNRAAAVSKALRENLLRRGS
jgi:DNA-binding NarL/FixJ family response regulator